MHESANEFKPDALAQRVASERSKHFPMALPHGIHAELGSRDDVHAFAKSNMELVFPGRPPRVNTTTERTQFIQPLVDHHAMLHSENIFFYDGAKPIGWSFGECQDSVSFYMRNTGLFSEFRSKGIYTAFLSKFLAYLTALGYERITSQHKPDNPAVLIPKIRTGFCIMAMELEERWGPLVRLVYYTQNHRRQAFVEMVR